MWYVHVEKACWFHDIFHLLIQTLVKLVWHPPAFHPKFIYQISIHMDCTNFQLHDVGTVILFLQLDSPIWFYTHESWWNPWITEDIEKLNILHVFSYFKHVITYDFQFSAPPGFNFSIIIIWGTFQCQQFINISFIKIPWIKICQGSTVPKFPVLWYCCGEICMVW